jgi:hypothetical protein
MSDHVAALTITLHLGSGLDRFLPPEGSESQRIDYHLRQFVGSIVDDLQLPLRIGVKVRQAAAGDDLPMEGLRVDMNDQRVMLGPNPRVHESSDGVAVAQWLARLLIVEPRYLLTRDIARKIRADWSERGVSWFEHYMTVDGFHALLLRLIERGFRIERALEWAEANDTSPEIADFPDEIFERVTAPLGTCTIGIAVEGRLYERLVRGEYDGDTTERSFRGLTRLMRDGLFYELGVYLPRATLEEEIGSGEGTFRFRLNDRRLLPQPPLEPGFVMVNATADQLNALGIALTMPWTNPANGKPATLIRDDPDAIARVEEHYHVWDNWGYIILALAAEVRIRGSHFVTRGIVKVALDRLEEAFPALVVAARARLGEERLTTILRALADEEISIRDLRGVLEALLAIRTTAVHDPDGRIAAPEYVCVVATPTAVNELTTAQLVAHVRRLSQRYLSYKYGRNASLNGYVLAPAIAARLRALPDRPLTAAEYDALLLGIIDALEAAGNRQNPVLIAPYDVRATARAVIRSFYPHFAVVAEPELTDDIDVQRITEIAWGEEVG